MSPTAVLPLSSHAHYRPFDLLCGSDVLDLNLLELVVVLLGLRLSSLGLTDGVAKVVVAHGLEDLDVETLRLDVSLQSRAISRVELIALVSLLLFLLRLVLNLDLS